MVPPQLVVLVAGIDAADINRLGQHARCIPVFAHMDSDTPEALALLSYPPTGSVMGRDSATVELMPNRSFTVLRYSVRVNRRSCLGSGVSAPLHTACAGVKVARMYLATAEAQSPEQEPGMLGILVSR